MRKQRVLGRTVSISVRFADFTDITRSTTMPSPTDVTEEIYSAALALYERLRLDRARIRRVGVRAEQLVDASRAYRQPQLTDPQFGWREADQAVDGAVRKYGPAAVQRAVLANLR
jgi:DNA polymerase IV